MGGQVNRERLLQEFVELVELYCPSGKEREAAEYVKNKLAELQLTVSEDDAGTKTGGNCGNLHVLLKGNAADCPSMMLSAHLDVVEPCEGVQAEVKDGVIQSAGDTVLGSDDKAGVAVLLETLRTIVENDLKHGDILAVFTIGEESGLYGSRHLDSAVLQSVDIGYALDSSGPPGKIIVQAPGQDNLHAVIRGKAAHAGIAPEKGINAIKILSQAVAAMPLGRIDAETTANIGIIKGGRAPNIVPDEVELWGEARSHNPAKLEKLTGQLRKALESAAADAGGTVELEIVPEYKNYTLTKDSLVVSLAVAAAEKAGLTVSLEETGGGSDSNIFNDKGLPTAVLGMGMEQVHTTKEQITEEHLYQAADWVVALVQAATER